MRTSPPHPTTRPRQIRWFGLLTLFLSLPLLAADLAIDSASWDDRRNILRVAGTAPDRAQVVVSDAATDETLESVNADRRGRWRVRISGLTQAPCDVRATSGGQSVERTVDQAPNDCTTTEPPPPPPPPPPPSEPPPPTLPPSSLGELQVFAANDLGMHCADLDYQVFSILPPFNVVHAQVIERGTSTTLPRLLDNSAVGVYYSATSNPYDPAGPGSINTTSVGKTNFWATPSGSHTLAFESYGALYPADDNGVSILNLFELLPPDLGLPVPDLVELMAGNLVAHQQQMPGAANTPRPFMRFDTDLPFFADLTVQGQTVGKVISGVNWFAADGIPILPEDDAGNPNAYPLMTVAAHDSEGTARASVDVVLPVASEADCQTCHAAITDFGNGAATEFASRSFDIMTEDQAVAAGLGQAGPDALLNAAKVNILRLHDAKHGELYTSSVDGSAEPCTSGTEDSCLDQRRSIQCAQCHYTPALDLAQVGPVNEAVPNGRQQTRHISMSRAMHGHHADLTGPFGEKLFPAMPAPNDPQRQAPAMSVFTNATDPSQTVTEYVLQETCYQCHPGKRTQCLRGAMAAGGVVCQDCHGGMAQVGNDFSGDLASNPAPDGLNLEKRIPWASEPACQSCHTGDAANPNHPAGAIVADDGIRLLKAFEKVILGDSTSTARPYRSPASRFAENEPLYRLSKGHGGVMCEGCHGSTHAIFPNPNPLANDNVASNQLQGHSGTIMECTTCHAAGSLGITLDGPHGMHPVNDSRWIRSHSGMADDHPELCTTCHGTDGRGSVLSRTPVARILTWSHDGRTESLTLAEDEAVTCESCHENKIIH